MIGVLGLGTASVYKNSDSEIERVFRKAVENGINFFDLCGGGKSVFEPFGRAVKDCRNKVYVQMHFGAVYNEIGEYAWSRDLDEIKRTMEWELNALKTDYIDFGFLHCVDEVEDFDELVSGGIFEHIRELKKRGIVRHIGFSSHTPLVAERVLDTGEID